MNKLLDDAINETRNLNDEELWSGIHGIYRRFILAITGEKDVQVDPEDVGRLKSLGKENIQGTVIKNMDHMLKEFKGDKTVINLMKQYKKEASQPTHPMLKEALANWLQQFRYSNISID